MMKFGKLALCLFVCFAAAGFLVQPVLAEHGWEEGPPQKGKPEDPPNPTVGPTYYGQPMMLDLDPWVDDPPRYGKPADPVTPTMSPSAWWLQPAVDDRPWEDDPPRKNGPEE